LTGGLGGLALLHLAQRRAEVGHEHVGRHPAEIASFVLAAGVFRLLGQLIPRSAFVELGDDVLGFVLFLHQDVARVEFVARVHRLDLLVGVLDLFFAHGVLGDEILEVGAHEHALTGELHLGLHFGALVEPRLLRLLGDDGAADELVLDRLAQLLVVGQPLGDLFLDDHVHVDLGDGLAIDLGHVLRQGGQGNEPEAEDGGPDGSAEFGVHGFPFTDDGSGARDAAPRIRV